MAANFLLRLFVIILFYDCLALNTPQIVTKNPNLSASSRVTNKFTIEQLLHTRFPQKQSNDIDVDICKAQGGILGDIALPKYDLDSYVQLKKDVSEGLQVEEEGLTDQLRVKLKQAHTDLTPSKRLVESSDRESKYFKNVKSDEKKPTFESGARDEKTSKNDLKNETNSHKNINLKSFAHRQRHSQNGAVWPKTNDETNRRKRYHHKRKRVTQQKDITERYGPNPEMPVHEDDDTFLTPRKEHQRLRRAATARKERIWEYGVIPYEIDTSFSGAHKALFKQAMRHWENFTCVKFVERDTDAHPNYIIFTERSCGCCSFVGKRGNGAQAISIGKNCDKFGIVVHELGHVVGFWHEHTRPDRDNHVQIFRDHIMNGQEYNFNKLTEDEVNSLGLAYDYESIMHYARNTFSKGTYLDTIAPQESKVRGKKTPEIGQRVKLSEGDIAQTNLLYKCHKCGRTLQEPSGTFSSPAYPNKLSTAKVDGDKCEWRITATHGERIVLNISDLDIYKSPNCSTDFIEIRDGYWQKSPILGRFCGSGRLNEPIVSTASRMLVTYVTSIKQAAYRGFIGSYEAVCGGDLEVNSSGHLESPNYPDYYTRDKECVWRLSVPINYTVVLRFHSFDIENHDTCQLDYVLVLDGFESTSRSLGKFCGYEPPPDIKSTSNHLLVKFVSDSTVQKAGFSASFMKELNECEQTDHGCQHFCINNLGSYECACRVGYELHSDGKSCEAACGGVFDTPNGTITSPSFPEIYPANKQCVWEVVAPSQYIITLNFTHFDLEGNHVYHQECEYDNVTIESKIDELVVLEHGVFCGTVRPKMIISETNAMRVTFNSDSSVHKSGFAAVFFTDKDECVLNNGGCEHECLNTLGSYRCTCHNGFVLADNAHDCVEGGCKFEIREAHGEISSPNYPDYYPARKDCVWHFSTTPGHRIKLVFDKFELEPHQECAYDHIVLYDGDSTEARGLGRVCGQKIPAPVVSSSNQMLMVFKSDASVQRKGFKAQHSTACGGYLQATDTVKHLYSHVKYGDSPYANKADCEWIIQAPEGRNVLLTFLTFDLEKETYCGYDFVKVYNGFDTSGLLYGKYCGNQNPTDIISSGEALSVHFFTDENVVSKGFSASYVAINHFEEHGATNVDETLDDEYDDSFDGDYDR